MMVEMSPQTLAAWTASDDVALLRNMLAIFTPSGAERPLTEWLVTQLAPLGFSAEVDAVGNLIAVLPATVSRPAAPCVLLGHVDTVRGEIPIRQAGDLLYGRGAVDAKGPLATFIAATICLARSGAPRQRPIIIVGAVEEEAATSRGARAVLDRWRPAYVVIGEPSGVHALTLGYKGRLLVSLRIEQAVAHTARPEMSAPARGVALWGTVALQATEWNAIHLAADEPAPAFAALQPSLRGIQSGSDGFTDWCELLVGYRLPPLCDIAALEAWLTELSESHSATLSFRGAEVAWQGTTSGPLVSAFVRALRSEGVAPSFKRKTGTSDMNVVAPVWQCPILAYGPGDAALDHTPNEHIALSEYAAAIGVLTHVLAELTAEGPERA